MSSGPFEDSVYTTERFIQEMPASIDLSGSLAGAQARSDWGTVGGLWAKWAPVEANTSDDPHNALLARERGGWPLMMALSTQAHRQEEEQ